MWGQLPADLRLQSLDEIEMSLIEMNEKKMFPFLENKVSDNLDFLH